MNKGVVLGFTPVEIMIVVAIIGLFIVTDILGRREIKEKSRNKQESGVTYYGNSIEIRVDGNRLDGKRGKLEISTK